MMKVSKVIRDDEKWRRPCPKCSGRLRFVRRRVYRDFYNDEYLCSNGHRVISPGRLELLWKEGQDE